MSVSVRLDREAVQRLRRLTAEKNLTAVLQGGEVRTFQDYVREAVDQFLGEQTR